MPTVELDKYINSAILPLYPDLADVPGKRIIIKLDSGPGRTNLDMLARLRLIGCYVVPGVPNTTGKTQETDQNYGPFKHHYRANIRTLTQARFDKKLSIGVHDLPFLVFGGKCSKTGVELTDAFSKAFSIQRNIGAWKKCGAVPLTRLPLSLGDVCREVPQGAAAARITKKDPEVEHLMNLENMNRFFCDILDANGMDGSKLRKEAPKRTTYVAVTAAVSQERVKAIKEAQTHGQLFYATGGCHTNSNEFFQARELKRREPEIKALEAKKKSTILYAKEQVEAVQLIKKKGELTYLREKDFTIPEIEKLLKWKKIPKAKLKRKEDMIEAYVKTPKPTKIQKTWTDSQEAELQKLKQQVLPMRETAVGVATVQMARAVTNNLAQLDTPTRTELKQSLAEWEENNAPNVL